MIGSSVSPERSETTTRVAAAVRQLGGVQRLGQRADLVDLPEQRVGRARLDALRPAGAGLVTNRSSPTIWMPRRRGQLGEALEVLLVQRILDRDDAEVARSARW